MAVELQEFLFRFPKIESLKPEQKEALEFLLSGRDVLAILPTGFGKSLIYQVFCQSCLQIWRICDQASRLWFLDRFLSWGSHSRRFTGMNVAKQNVAKQTFAKTFQMLLARIEGNLQ